MAQRGVQLDRETFSCSICLDLLKNPVTIPCGHSYCMSCIKTHWDEEFSWKNHSCPQCRKSFTQRPVLVKNTMLADLAEKLKKTGLPAAPADHCYAGPEDVACDVCSGRQRKAAKFCLRCLVSYCDEHLQPHYRSPAFKKHKLVEPSKNLQENICSQHNEVMVEPSKKLQNICFPQDDVMEMLCCPDETHNDHDTVSAAAERRERQKELEGSRLNIQQRIQDREKDVKLLQQEVEAINRSADKTVEDTEEMFTEVSRLRELQEKLQQEITELKRRDAELEELSHTEDHTQFLQNLSSVSALSEATSSMEHCEGATAAVSEVTEEDTEERRRDNLQDGVREKLKNASLTEVDHQPEPRTRAEFLKYSYDLTLDPKTANQELLLSSGMRKASLKINHLFFLSGPERFSSCCQVLSKESLTGRCYWEVKWSGRGLLVAVAYKSISRTGSLNECAFGLNDKSWALKCEVINYTFWHNSVQTPVSGPLGSRIGVYLDHRAGVLSFYSVSKTMTLLHRVQTTFTQPLHAGLWLLYSYGATAEFCKLI